MAGIGRQHSMWTPEKRGLTRGNPWTLVWLQPRVGGGDGGKSPDMIVEELVTAITDSLPPTLDAETANEQTFATNEEGMMTSLAVVLSQEMARFQKLQKKMKSSLGELLKAIRGLVVMSGELELMYQSLLNNQVCSRSLKVCPEAWVSPNPNLLFLLPRQCVRRRENSMWRCGLAVTEQT
jgi:hypothetical protein